jgi:hypothetical protein
MHPSQLILLLAAAVHTVRDEQAALRSACGPGEPVVATVRRGDPVQVRFVFNGDSGPCYKVAVASGGTSYEGYLPANAVTAVEEFERARRQAAYLDRSEPLSSGTTPPAGPAKALHSTGDPAPSAWKLVEDGRPEAALALLDEYMKSNRRDAGILALAGLAAYRADQVRRAMGYWKESLELAPSPNVERYYRDAEREIAADQSSEKLVGARFHLRYDPTEVQPEQARAILPMLDAEFARIAEHLGCRAEERIGVIVQSRRAYLKTTGASEWSGGRYDGRIHVAAPDGRANSEETRRGLVHEMVHACLVRLGSWPAWLHEGLAQKLSGETLAPARREEVRKLARTGGLPSLGKLAATWSRMSAQHAAIAYATALAAAELFYEVQGPWGVRNLMQNPESLERIMADLDRRLRQ